MNQQENRLSWLSANNQIKRIVLCFSNNFKLYNMETRWRIEKLLFPSCHLTSKHTHTDLWIATNTQIHYSQLIYSFYGTTRDDEPEVTNRNGWNYIIIVTGSWEDKLILQVSQEVGYVLNNWENISSSKWFFYTKTLNVLLLSIACTRFIRRTYNGKLVGLFVYPYSYFTSELKHWIQLHWNIYCFM